MEIKKVLTLIVLSWLLIAAITPPTVFSCYAVIAGKKATADGSVIFAHSELNNGRRFLNFRVVPRIKNKSGTMIKLHNGGTYPDVSESYSFIWKRNPITC